MTLGWELTVLHTSPSMLGKLLVHRGSVELWMKNILYWFNEGSNSSGMPRCAKTSLALNELK